jgi:hypothetical protein
MNMLYEGQFCDVAKNANYWQHRSNCKSCCNVPAPAVPPNENYGFQTARRLCNLKKDKGDLRPESKS